MGPIRLPGRDAEEFMVEFNQVYRSLGWCVARLVEVDRVPAAE